MSSDVYLWLRKLQISVWLNKSTTVDVFPLLSRLPSDKNVLLKQEKCVLIVLLSPPVYLKKLFLFL